MHNNLFVWRIRSISKAIRLELGYSLIHFLIRNSHRIGLNRRYTFAKLAIESGAGLDWWAKGIAGCGLRAAGRLRRGLTQLGARNLTKHVAPSQLYNNHNVLKINAHNNRKKKNTKNLRYVEEVQIKLGTTETPHRSSIAPLHHPGPWSTTGCFAPQTWLADSFCLNRKSLVEIGLSVSRAQSGRLIDWLTDWR